MKTEGDTEGDPVAALANALESGELTPDQAAERLVELAISRGPATKLPPEARERLREEMRLALRRDPILAARARRLGMTTDDDETS